MRPGRLPAVLALLGVTLAGTALAVAVNGTLYVRAKNTHLKDSVQPTAATLEILQPGMPVTYGGREGSTPWHRVKVETQRGALQGFIYQANLATSPPSLEITSSKPDKPLSPQAFASSGAAIKAMGPGAIAYGRELSRPESVDQLQSLEDLAQAVSSNEVSDYARAGGLPSVVGSPTVAARAPAAKTKPGAKTQKGKKP